METVGPRFKRLRTEANLTLQKVGDTLGCTRSAVASWEREETRPDPDKLPRLAKLYGVTVEYLLTGKPLMVRESAAAPYLDEPSPRSVQILAWESPDDLPPGEFVQVPQLNVELSAGNGRAVVTFDTEQSIAFMASWIRQQHLRPKALVAMYAKGESMEPRINDGDALMIDTDQKTVADGKVYALRYGNELRVKRLFKRFDGALRIVSDNPSFREEIVNGTDLEHVEVLGRVVWIAGSV